MKTLLTTLLCVASCTLAEAQSDVKAVMVASNGLISKPTNFIVANNIATNATARFFGVQIVTFADLATERTGSASTEVAGSFAAVSIPATNVTAEAGIRLMSRVNTRGSLGEGTGWGRGNHSFWTTFDFAIGLAQRLRFVAGGSSFGATNLAMYPTNKAVGFEVRRTSTNDFDPVEIRLIAHNGTTSTNGPWVEIGNIFQKHTVGVQQRTNGSVRLYVSIDDVTQPELKADAGINGGPTANASIGLNSWDFGISTTNTNIFNAGATVYTAWSEYTRN